MCRGSGVVDGCNIIFVSLAHLGLYVNIMIILFSNWNHKFFGNFVSEMTTSYTCGSFFSHLTPVCKTII